MAATRSAVIRVVLIDDHEIVRNGLRFSLAGEPAIEVVGEADDGPSGISLVDATRPDVVLLDVRLPTMSGVDVCGMILQRAPDTRIVILSAFGEEELVYQCIMAGARGYILKDIVDFDLKRTLVAVVRGETVVDPRLASGLFDRIRGGETSPSHGLPPHQFSVLRLMASGSTSPRTQSRVMSRRF